MFKRLFQLGFVAALVSGIVIFFMSESPLDTSQTDAQDSRPKMGAVGAAIQIPAHRISSNNDFAAVQNQIPSVQSPLATADIYLRAHLSEWHVLDYHELRPEPTVTALGTTVKYQVFQDGIPVVDMSIVVHVLANGNVTAESSYQPIPRVDPSATGMEFEDIIRNFSDQFSENSDADAQSNRVIALDHSLGRPIGQLAYQAFLLDRDSGNPVEVVFRATDGQILRKTPGHFAAAQ